VEFLTSLFVCLALPFGGAFVVKLLSSSNGDFALDFAVLQVESGRDESEAFFLDFALQLIDLLPMEKKLAFAHRLVILTVSVGVLTDMRIEQPSLVINDVRIAFLQLHL